MHCSECSNMNKWLEFCIYQCCVTRVGTQTLVHFTRTRTRVQFFSLWLGLGLRNRDSGPSHARVQAVAAVPCCAVYSDIRYILLFVFMFLKINKCWICGLLDSWLGLEFFFDSDWRTRTRTQIWQSGLGHSTGIYIVQWIQPQVCAWYMPFSHSNQSERYLYFFSPHFKSSFTNPYNLIDVLKPFHIRCKSYIIKPCSYMVFSKRLFQFNLQIKQENQWSSFVRGPVHITSNWQIFSFSCYIHSKHV